MSALLVVALAFVLAGLGFKLSLVPFHMWTADVYQGAPTAVTSYLSVISKGAAAFAFFIIFAQVFGAVYADAWEWMLYAVIILTITIGNLFAIRQKNMKRFMAFSSVSQAGYVMLGAIAADSLGMASMMFYIFVYIVSNLGAFAVISTIEQRTGHLNMNDYNGLHKTNPWLSFAMTLAMFSLAGIHGSLYACLGSADQYNHLALLLPACGEGNVDQPRRTEDRDLPQRDGRPSCHLALRSGHHLLRSGALHLPILRRCRRRKLRLHRRLKIIGYKETGYKEIRRSC